MIDEQKKWQEKPEQFQVFTATIFVILECVIAANSPTNFISIALICHCCQHFQLQLLNIKGFIVLAVEVLVI